ncbi:MAG: hypothetical protein AABZ47_14565 [Planctomycetota bacterium]
MTTTRKNENKKVNKMTIEEMKAKETTRANRRLKTGTLVVSNEDGEPGHIAQVCTYRRNGVDAWSYAVETKYGREVWEVGELFTPDQGN